MVKLLLVLLLSVTMAHSKHRHITVDVGIKTIPVSFVIQKEGKIKTIRLSRKARAKLTGILNAVLTGEVNRKKDPLLARTVRTSCNGTLHEYLNGSKGRWHPITGIQFTKKTLKATLKTSVVSKHSMITKKVVVELFLVLCKNKGIIKDNGKISKSYLFLLSKAWASIDKSWTSHVSRYPHNTSFLTWWTIHTEVKRQLRKVGLKYS